MNDLERMRNVIDLAESCNEICEIQKHDCYKDCPLCFYVDDGVIDGTLSLCCIKRDFHMMTNPEFAKHTFTAIARHEGIIK